MSFSSPDDRFYERERSKSTINLLNYSTLYASYIDVCRRIRRYVGLDNNSSYDRAINRLLQDNSGEHEFIKQFRNFLLHHHLIEPHVVVSYGDKKTVRLLLEADELVRDGSKWSARSRDFLAANRSIDVISLTNKVSKDISRLIDFHKRMAANRLKDQKYAYDWYQHERSKSKQLANSIARIEIIFKKKPIPLVLRYVDKDTLISILSSSMSDRKVRSILGNLANMHKKLPEDMQRAVDREITNFLRKRVRFPTTESYVNGQPFPRKGSVIIST